MHVSSGTYESMPVIIEPYMYKEGWKSYLAQEVKQGLNIPVIAVGAIKRPAKAEEILSQKKATLSRWEEPISVILNGQ